MLPTTVSILATCAVLCRSSSLTIPAPHPVITEVLFHVPKDESCDANKDGVRDAAGDEFIELINPHASSVNLKGYVLTNRLRTGKPDGRNGVMFTFPEFTLPPGAIVVVFNGFQSDLSGPVGDAENPPAAPNDQFGGAYVFSMNAAAPNHALSNAGDFILLSAPDGTPLDAISWNAPDPPPPARTIRVTEVKLDPKGSVQRKSPAEDPVRHIDLTGAPFSPGTIP